jgi:hypothetical protein
MSKHAVDDNAGAGGLVKNPVPGINKIDKKYGYAKEKMTLVTASS